MKTWSTEITAIDPITGDLKLYAGPNITAATQNLAKIYCQRNGLGYCRVGDQIIAEIPCDKNYNPNWNKIVEYDE